MQNIENLKKSLDKGELIDIKIPEVNIADWANFIDFLNSKKKWDLSIEFEAFQKQKISIIDFAKILDWFEKPEPDKAILSIIIKFHFFQLSLYYYDENQIELALSGKYLGNNLNEVIVFFEEVHNLLNKKIFFFLDNDDDVILEI